MLRAIVVLSLIVSLAACGNSRLNPFNWFGGEREQRIRVEPDADGSPILVDGRVLIPELTQLSVEQTTNGAIVRATGVTPMQGYFEADLVQVERTDSALVFEFRVATPQGNASAGLQEIVAGTSLSVGDLQGIRSITVIAQNNRRTVNRR